MNLQIAFVCINWNFSLRLCMDDCMYFPSIFQSDTRVPSVSWKTVSTGSLNDFLRILSLLITLCSSDGLPVKMDIQFGAVIVGSMFSIG